MEMRWIATTDIYMGEDVGTRQAVLVLEGNRKGKEEPLYLATRLHAS